MQPEDYRTEMPEDWKEGSQSENERLPNEADALREMVAWAYGKLHRQNYSKLDDALMLDRMKLMLEHGVL